MTDEEMIAWLRKEPRSPRQNEIADTIEALRAENARLREALNKANTQSERFEREWYLRGDEIERLREVSRWNIERDGDDIYICDNNHAKGDKCEYERWYHRAYVEDLRAENARLMKLLSDTNTYYAECIAEREDLKQETAELKRAVKTAVFADSAELKDCKAENARLREALKRLLYAGHTIDENKLAKHEWSFWADELRAARAVMGESDE